MIKMSILSQTWYKDSNRIKELQEWGKRVKKLLDKSTFTKLNFDYKLESNDKIDYKNHVIPDFETVSNDD